MVKSDAAPNATPPSFNGGDSSKQTRPDSMEVMYQQNLFYMTVLNMSWQLAIAVIVPIVAGFKLDERYSTSPWLTLAGLLVAAAASILVVATTVRRATIKAERGAPK